MRDDLCLFYCRVFNRFSKFLIEIGYVLLVAFAAGLTSFVSLGALNASLTSLVFFCFQEVGASSLITYSDSISYWFSFWSFFRCCCWTCNCFSFWLCFCILYHLFLQLLVLRHLTLIIKCTNRYRCNA